VYEKGDFFGEAAWFPDMCNGLLLNVLSDLHVLWVNQADFQQTLEDNVRGLSLLNETK
jgi:hypothetical protein